MKIGLSYVLLLRVDKDNTEGENEIDLLEGHKEDVFQVAVEMRHKWRIELMKCKEINLNWIRVIIILFFFLLIFLSKVVDKYLDYLLL